ncbi:eukaryotic translation initiation factor 4 gamma 3-like isoform X2 [Sycon ciliatum]|uniref:eukaryotic translation initiation factor 4 gamma 3-like isoform X2 n=1 Tax=Sycon ciliatum TaxID=27933 RepID=UPI0031F64CC5
MASHQPNNPAYSMHYQAGMQQQPQQQQQQQPPQQQAQQPRMPLKQYTVPVPPPNAVPGYQQPAGVYSTGQYIPQQPPMGFPGTRMMQPGQLSQQQQQQQQQAQPQYRMPFQPQQAVYGASVRPPAPMMGTGYQQPLTQAIPPQSMAPQPPTMQQQQQQQPPPPQMSQPIYSAPGAASAALNQTPPSSTTLPPAQYANMQAVPLQQPTAAVAAAAAAAAAEPHAEQHAPNMTTTPGSSASRTKVTLKDPNTGEDLFSTMPKKSQPGARAHTTPTRGQPSPASSSSSSGKSPPSTTTPQGHSTVNRTSSLSHEAPVFKPTTRTMSAQPSTSGAGAAKPSALADGNVTPSRPKLNLAAKEFKPPDVAFASATNSDNTVGTEAQSSTTASASTTAASAVTAVTTTTASSSLAQPQLPVEAKSEPEASGTSTSEPDSSTASTTAASTAANSAVTHPQHTAGSASPVAAAKTRSRSPSPPVTVTSGAPTQASLTFEDRQDQPESDNTANRSSSSQLASGTPGSEKASEDKTDDQAFATASASKPGSAANAGSAEKPSNPPTRDGSAESSPSSSRKKPSIEYNDPSQWTPDNQAGNKIYSRDFLMQFQSIQVTKPPQLPSIDGVTDNRKPRSDPRGNFGGGGGGGGGGYGGGNNTFLPGYLQNTVGSNGGGAMGRGPGPSGGGGARRQSRPSQSGSGGRAPPARVIQLTQKEEPLKNSENRWVRSTQRKADASDGEKATEALSRAFRGFLNKLTPEKFETIAEKIKGLVIDTEERLTLVIELIFEKSLSEPKFSPSYASLCRHMLTIKVPVSDETENSTVSFRKKLLTRCQAVFEQDKANDKKAEKVVLLKEQLEKTPDNKELICEKLELEDALASAKRRSLGNIRFIGELFKLKILTEPIMHECIVKLLRASDDESLEALCNLLSTVGKDLDHEKATKRISEYFDRIQKIIDGGRLINRIKFMLQDVIELRKHNWTPRRDDNKPKTITEIHKEAKEAELKTKIESQNAQLTARHGSKSGIRNRGSGGRDNDGWSAPARPSRVSLDSDKLASASQRLHQQSRDGDQVQLGPGGKSFGWGRGSSGGSTAAATSRDERPSNRYATLAAGAPDPPRSTSRGGRPEPRASSSGAPRRGSSSREQPGGRSSAQKAKEREREEALSLVRMSSSSHASPSEEKATQLGGAAAAASASGAGNRYSEEKAVEKSMSILREYFDIHDIKEVFECLQELQSPGHFSAIISAWLNHVVDKKPVKQITTGRLICKLMSADYEGLFTARHISDGVHAFLEQAEDLSLDIPLFWRYCGNFLAPIAIHSPSVLGPISQSGHLLDMCKAATLMAEIMLAMKSNEELSEESVGKIWRTSKLLWSDVLMQHEPSEEEFLDRKGLKFLSGGVDVGKHVKTMLEGGVPDSAIIDWISANVSRDDQRRKPFIQALVSALVSHSVVPAAAAAASIAPKYTMDSKQLIERKQLLVKYLDSDVTRQLYAVLAVEALVFKLEHPKGLLHEIFNALYVEAMCDAIEEEAFFMWQKLPAGDAPQGHGVAVQSVMQFINFLRSADKA